MSRKVGILSIQRDQFNIEPIPLKTVRPFKIGDIVLEEEADDEESGIDLEKRETITAFLRIKVGDTIGCWNCLDSAKEFALGIRSRN
jgi:double-strand break repair protein MRE11